MSCLLVWSDVVRCQPGSAEIHLHLQIARDHAMILKFNSPSRIITGHKLVAASYADGSGGPFSRPARLRRARSPVRTSPLASELPLTCEALPFAGGPSGPYLPGCARQLFNVRCAHYARGALLTNQSSPVPAAARPPEGHWRAHSAAAPCRPPHAPPGGALACAPGSGTLPLTPRNLVPADVQLLFFGCPPPDNAGKSIQRFHAPSVPR